MALNLTPALLRKYLIILAKPDGSPGAKKQALKHIAREDRVDLTGAEQKTQPAVAALRALDASALAAIGVEETTVAAVLERLAPAKPAQPKTALERAQEAAQAWNINEQSSTTTLLKALDQLSVEELANNPNLAGKGAVRKILLEIISHYENDQGLTASVLHDQALFLQRLVVVYNSPENSAGIKLQGEKATHARSLLVDMLGETAQDIKSTLLSMYSSRGDFVSSFRTFNDAQQVKALLDKMIVSKYKVSESTQKAKQEQMLLEHLKYARNKANDITHKSQLWQEPSRTRSAVPTGPETVLGFSSRPATPPPTPPAAEPKASLDMSRIEASGYVAPEQALRTLERNTVDSRTATSLVLAINNRTIPLPEDSGRTKAVIITLMQQGKIADHLGYQTLELIHAKESAAKPATTPPPTPPAAEPKPAPLPLAMAQEKRQAFIDKVMAQINKQRPLGLPRGPLALPQESVVPTGRFPLVFPAQPPQPLVPARTRAAIRRGVEQKRLAQPTEFTLPAPAAKPKAAAPKVVAKPAADIPPAVMDVIPLYEVLQALPEEIAQLDQQIRNISNNLPNLQRDWTRAESEVKKAEKQIIKINRLIQAKTRELELAKTNAAGEIKQREQEGRQEIDAAFQNALKSLEQTRDEALEQAQRVFNSEKAEIEELFAETEDGGKSEIRQAEQTLQQAKAKAQAAFQEGLNRAETRKRNQEAELSQKLDSLRSGSDERARRISKTIDQAKKALAKTSAEKTARQRRAASAEEFVEEAEAEIARLKTERVKKNQELAEAKTRAEAWARENLGLKV